MNNYSLQAILRIDVDTKFEEYVDCILNNAIKNNFDFFDVEGNPLNHLDLKKMIIINEGKQFAWQVQVKSQLIKIEVWPSWILMYPSKSVLKHMFKEGCEQTIDTAFYIRLLLSLCQNFAIREFTCDFQ